MELICFADNSGCYIAANVLDSEARFNNKEFLFVYPRHHIALCLPEVPVVDVGQQKFCKSVLWHKVVLSQVDFGTDVGKPPVNLNIVLNVERVRVQIYDNMGKCQFSVHISPIVLGKIDLEPRQDLFQNPLAALLPNIIFH